MTTTSKKVQAAVEAAYVIELNNSESRQSQSVRALRFALVAYFDNPNLETTDSLHMASKFLANELMQFYAERRPDRLKQITKGIVRIKTEKKQEERKLENGSSQLTPEDEQEFRQLEESLKATYLDMEDKQQAEKALKEELRNVLEPDEDFAMQFFNAVKPESSAFQSLLSDACQEAVNSLSYYKFQISQLAKLRDDSNQRMLEKGYSRADGTIDPALYQERAALSLPWMTFSFLTAFLEDKKSLRKSLLVEALYKDVDDMMKIADEVGELGFERTALLIVATCHDLKMRLRSQPEQVSLPTARKSLVALKRDPQLQQAEASLGRPIYSTLLKLYHKILNMFRALSWSKPNNYHRHGGRFTEYTFLPPKRPSSLPCAFAAMSDPENDGGGLRPPRSLGVTC